MPNDTTTPRTLGLEVLGVARISFAAAQNSVPLLSKLKIVNETSKGFESLVLEMKPHPPFCRGKTWTVDKLPAGESIDLSDLRLSFSQQFLAGLNESEKGELEFILRSGEEKIASEIHELELLARDEWGGGAEMAQLLVAFVSPNHPVVAAILKKASMTLERSGHSGAMNGYQSKDPARAWLMAAAIWTEFTQLGLSYAEPPKSFENVGQKVRDPGAVREQGLATCLDTSLILASALEACGLNPVVVFTQGHAFAGVWLCEKTFDKTVVEEVTSVRKAIVANELKVFETTLLTQRPSVGFELALQVGAELLTEDRESEFQRVIDVSRARSAGIKPLASHQAVEEEERQTEVAPASLPAAPQLAELPAEVAEELPPTPEGRIHRWQKKLLDLTLRNRLLNFSATQQTLSFECPELGALEDELAEGRSFRIISLRDEDPVGGRDGEAFFRENGRKIDTAFVQDAFERRELCSPVSAKELERRLVTLHRKAKSDIKEGGANTLFLAFGFLRWKKSDNESRVYRSPLLLLPVELSRSSARSNFTLKHRSDDVRFNETLLELLKQDFDIEVPALRGDLPTDHSGLDIKKIFDHMRLAVRDVVGFEVVEDVALSTFSFAKYLMWKDLVELEKEDRLRSNSLIRNLLSEERTTQTSEGESFPVPGDIDRRFAPRDLFTPLPADSSQLAAVVAAQEGHNFVIVGPPGTGKSQTIANMIAHCIANKKTVLFVSEKAAALDVVSRRLKANGLGDACLELHSNKTDRKEVIQQLGQAWDRRGGQSEREWVKVNEDLQCSRDELNKYVELLHEPGSHGYSIFEGIGVVSQKRGEVPLSFVNVDAHDRESFHYLVRLADKMGLAYREVEKSEGLSVVGCGDWSFGWEQKLFESVSSLRAAIVQLLTASHELEGQLGINSNDDVSDARLDALQASVISLQPVVGQDFESVFDERFGELETGLAQLQDELKEYRAVKARLSTEYADEELDALPASDLDRRWRESEAKPWPLSKLGKRGVKKILQTYATGKVGEAGEDLKLLRQMQNRKIEILKNPVQRLPGFAGSDTDLEGMKLHLEQAKSVRASLEKLQKVAANTVAVAARMREILTPHREESELLTQADFFNRAFAEYREAEKKLLGVAEGRFDVETLNDRLEALSQLEAGRGRLGDWTKWVLVRDEAIARGLEPLVESLLEGRTAAAEASGEFERSYFTWWLPLAMDQKAELRKFAHWEHHERVLRFCRLDAEVQELARGEVIRRIQHGLPAKDIVSKREELGGLRHQMNLQRPSISVRDLIASMPTTFQKLAPCVMMSPLSVAQFMPVAQEAFDLVIFDEASQITTWDAVGAIARGKQAVIVGDPKQLPPTNFFGRTEEDNEDLDYFEKDQPSILEEASSAGLRNHQLNWHYRSRDENLIAFSNRHYYRNQLVTFPSPVAESQALTFHHISDGVYARGAGRTNSEEAKSIVSLIVKRLHEELKKPEEERLTFGVITFNSQQQELILDLLDERRREDAKLEWFFSDDREEALIVKNLENIQGDERDVMMFSITFGPDLEGKMEMDFGAVNRDGGEKRLNVAVTRARAEMHVFSTITSNQIDLSRTKALGVHHLRNYLDFAERGAVALATTDDGSLGPAENPFEEAIAEALQQKGWDVRTQVGVSGYRIDLGVIDPERAGNYIAGIECDGATYHSSATARDRDKIREAVLVGLGWSILRIWSTDWFRNSEEVLSRIDEALHALVDEERRRRESDLAAQEELESEEVVSASAELAEEFSDGDIGIVADGTRFYDDDYRSALEAQILALVSKESPIREDNLVRELSSAHGFGRSGKQIRQRVRDCLGTCEVHSDGRADFVWLEETFSQEIPFRMNLERSPKEISQSEYNGLLSDERGFFEEEDSVRALAEKLGVARLTKETRELLTHVLEEFKKQCDWNALS